MNLLLLSCYFDIPLITDLLYWVLIFHGCGYNNVTDPKKKPIYFTTHFIKCKEV